MAEAILGGILGAKLAAPSDIKVGEPLKDRRAHLSETYGVQTLADNGSAAAGAEIVILSVKPQQLAGVMAELAPALAGGQVVLSIVAGARISTLTAGLGHSAVIRVMPNTPARIGAGMTVWTATSEVPEQMIAASRDILRTLGEELYLHDEKLMDMATALSASGPAYVFLFIEALIEAGVYMGMPRDMSRKLVLQTVLGSTRLVQETGRHPAELKEMVTSPGGGTAEALLALEQGGFRAVVIDAVAAAYEKYKELGAEN